jgi:hypothetical protein
MRPPVTVQVRWHWAVRVAVAAVLFPLLPRPVPPPLELGPPQTVSTTHPNVCVHTRLTDEVESWKILRSLEMVREMGAPTIVEYFPWAYYAPERGRYDFGPADLRIDLARHQGLTVIARLGGIVPAWARMGPDGPIAVETYLSEDGYQAFTEFVAAFVAHFRGRVDHIIIWNEPNVTLEWGFRRVDPEAYTRLLATAYAAAKAVNPEVQVLGGALAPTLEPEGSDLALDDRVYLARMIAAGALETMDGLAVHAYGLTFPPEADPAPDALNFRRVELLQTQLEAAGRGALPIYITEAGWNDSPRWTRAVSPGARIDHTLRAFAYAEQHWPTVKVVCIWAFRYPAAQRAYGDYFTLVTPEFVTKPIYDAILDYANER